MSDPFAAIATPIQSDPFATIAQPLAAKPSFGQRIRENFMEGIGITNDEGAKNFFEHPINTLMNSLDAQGQLALKAKAAYAKGDYKGALMYGLNYLVPFIGQQTAKAGEQLNEGDYAGGIARTLGVALPLLAGSPESRAGAGRAASAAAAPVKSTVAKVAGAASDIVDPDITGIVSPRLASTQRALGKLSDALRKSQQAHGAVTASDDAVYPGANLPEKPAPELLQSRALADPGASPAPPPEAALGEIPVAPTPPRPLPAGFQSPTAPYREPIGTAGNPLPVERVPDVPVAPTPPETQPTVPRGVERGPQPVHGDSALRQVLTGQDNANLLKIARSRGINVTKEAQLRPGIADNVLVNKIIDDMSNDELDEIGAKYMQNQSKHKFGDVGPEAWKTMSLQTYFPELKIPGATLARVQKAIAKNTPVPSETEDLTDVLQKSLEVAQQKKR